MSQELDGIQSVLMVIIPAAALGLVALWTAFVCLLWKWASTPPIHASGGIAYHGPQSYAKCPLC